MKSSLQIAMLGAVATTLSAGNKEHFEITPDQDMIKQKQLYLDQLRQTDFSHSENRPNIIFIVVDDLGKYDSSLYGLGGNNVKTPHLEKLAAQGALFQEGLCTAPICSPSRAGILTGRQQQRFGFEYRLATIYPTGKGMVKMADNLIDLGDMHLSERTDYPNKRQMKQQGMPVSEISVAEMLQAAGYSTAMIGKWDVGYDNGMCPEDFGFDYTFGFLEAYTLFDNPNDPDIVNSRQDNFQNRFIWRQGRKGTCAIRRNGEKIKEKEYLTFAFTREAINFTDQNKENPFFIYLSYNAPHTPFQVPKRYYNLFPEVKDHNKRVYFGMIKALDDSIGDLMAKLERDGLMENTLICFASDNGGAEYTGATHNGPLKGGKFSNFEGGLNIPYAISWPKVIAGGTKIANPVSTLDFFTTAAAAAEVPFLPKDRIYDGINLLNLTNEKNNLTNDRKLYWRAGYNKCMRMGPWKMIINEKTKKEELYKLDIDKTEKNNLISSESAITKQMKALYAQWEKEVSPEAWPNVMDYYYEIDGEPYYFAL